MIQTNYIGRVGNNMFQYVFNRMIAERCNLYFEETTSHPYWKDCSSKNFPVDVIPYDNKGRVKLSHGDVVRTGGYYQDPRIYDNNRDLIKSFFKYDINKRKHDSVTAHIRLKDYYEFGKGVVIHPEWYVNIFKMLCCDSDYVTLYIVSDDVNDSYMDNFKEFNPIFISNSPKEDFQFIMNSNIIVCGNSSFSWWASWFSEASMIYTFKPWIYRNENREYNLSQMHRAIQVDGAFL